MSAITERSSSASAPCLVCPNSCDRKGVWQKQVDSKLDFCLDLSIDPAADMGCGDNTIHKEVKKCALHASVVRAGDADDDDDELAEATISDEETDSESRKPCCNPPRINILEPDGVEAKLCALHVEQLVRERLFLFGEDCKYSIWLFPKQDYLSTVWKLDSDRGLGDPDIANLVNHRKALGLKGEEIEDGIGEELKSMVLSEPYTANRVIQPSKSSWYIGKNGSLGTKSSFINANKKKNPYLTMNRLTWIKNREIGALNRMRRRNLYKTTSCYQAVNNSIITPNTSTHVMDHPCCGPIKLWSDIRNVSHLYHVVPLDQSEAEITLEELSHPEVFKDSRIGCSIQVINRGRENENEDEAVPMNIDEPAPQPDISNSNTLNVPTTPSSPSPNSLHVPTRTHLRRSFGSIPSFAPQSPVVPPRNNRIQALNRRSALLQSADSVMNRLREPAQTSIIRSNQSNTSTPSTPNMSRLRAFGQQSNQNDDDDLSAAALMAEEYEQRNGPPAERMRRRRSTVSAAALSSFVGPQVKVVSTTTPLAYKRRGGEDLLHQLFEAGVHCRARHKYVSFIDAPLAPVTPSDGWNGIQEFFSRFKLMCSMSAIAIVNESRDKRRRIITGKSDVVEPSKSSNRLSGIDPVTKNRLKSSSSYSDLQMTENVTGSSSPAPHPAVPKTVKSVYEWQLVTERASLIIDLQNSLTNYGSFWNEHYFRRRLSMPLHGTVLAARSDPVFAVKNPDVIAHYLGEANTAGGVTPDLCDGRRPEDGVFRPLPPPLVASDPTIVHQSFTLTFYPDLEGGFSASLEYLTLHSATCSVSVLDHARRKYLLTQLSKRFGNHEAFNGLTAQRRLLMEHSRNSHSWNSSIWRTIEDVVAGLKVPESSKSTHTYKQSTLDHVIELLKEKTATALFYEEQQYREREQRFNELQQQQRENRSPTSVRIATPTPLVSVSVAEEPESTEDTELLQQFGLIDEIEEEIQRMQSPNDANSETVSYRFGPPIRWTYLPSVQFYQTRISI